VYALDHVKGLGPAPDRKKLDAIRADIKRLPKESAAGMEELLQRYDLMTTIVAASSESARALHKALALVPVSDWARQLRAEPAGATFPGRRVMFTDGPEGRRYFDVMEGRFLTAEESKAAR
jgi:hypothetical protein